MRILKKIKKNTQEYINMRDYDEIVLLLKEAKNKTTHHIKMS